jgi:hypothetical protein
LHESKVLSHQSISILKQDGIIRTLSLLRDSSLPGLPGLPLPQCSAPRLPGLDSSGEPGRDGGGKNRSGWSPKKKKLFWIGLGLFITEFRLNR